ncbi:MAG: hydrogen peroxide-inducible genes activator [Enterobacterales bacterium]|nr:hydrogen peroxide-inducible genes activator [Enterobacterales bacterium]
MTYLPTLKQLKYLISVVEHKHFGHAAKACHVSQSTLSAGIAELEHNLGVILIERDQKGVKLLPIGEEISRRAQDIMTASQDLVESAFAAQAPFTTELKLGVIPTVAPFILPPILDKVRKMHPDFKIYIREEMSQPLTDALLNGQLDLLLLALPFPAENVHTMHLFDDDFLLAVHQQHRLSDYLQVTIPEVINEDLLLLEDGHCIRDHALDACALNSDELSVPYQATSLNTAIQMVANKMGITFLPQMAIAANLAHGLAVNTIPFKDNRISRSIGLMWRQNTPRAQEFRALGEIIASIMN